MQIIEFQIQAILQAIAIYFQMDYGGSWRTGLLLSIVMLIPALFAFGFGLKGNCGRAFKATVLQGLILIVAIAQFAFPVLGAYHSARDIAQQAIELQRAGEPIIAFRFFHHSLDYYTDYGIASELKEPKAVRRFVQTHSSALIVTDIKGLKTLSGIRELEIHLLAEQGNFRLIRINS